MTQRPKLKNANIFMAFWYLMVDVYSQRYAIWQLTKRDYKNRYVGSAFGFVWTILQPLAMITVLWLVFAKAFQRGDLADGVPFIAWLTVGMIVWEFFSEVIKSATKVFNSYSYLVKKINFRIAVLPIVKILSSLFVHIIFVFIAIAIILFAGVDFSLYWFQFLYYLVAMLLMILGISWITSSLQVFFQDTEQIVSIFLRFGFWLTPIFWQIDFLPESYRFWFKLNPMFYIVEGYRNSFIYEIPFWQDLNLTIYFWALTIFFLVVGGLLFRRLRPHFSDVL